jgi:hypothetical protein
MTRLAFSIYRFSNMRDIKTAIVDYLHHYRINRYPITYLLPELVSFGFAYYLLHQDSIIFQEKKQQTLCHSM